MLLIDTDPVMPLTHRDGRRFTPSEIVLATSAIPDDYASAAEVRGQHHLQELPATRTFTATADLDQIVFRAALRLIRATPDAANLEDVARIHGRSQVALLAEQTGISTAQVREVIERNPSDYIPGPATP